jgi:predicted PurR-regulated permease PerM
MVTKMKDYEVPLIPTRQLILWTLGATAVIGCFWLLWRFQNVLLLLITAILLSTAVSPGVLWLEKRGIPKPAGILLMFGLIGLLCGLLVWYSLPVLAEQASAISQNVAESYQSLRQSLERLPNLLLRRLLFILPEELPWLAGEEVSTIPDTGLELPDASEPGNRLLLGMLQFVVVLILTFYWTLERSRIKQAAFLLVPLPERDNVRELVQEIEAKVSGYLLGQGVLCLIIGGLAFTAYLLIGLPNALLLAIFAGLLEAVPVVGPFLGAVPAIMVGLSISPATAIWVVVATGIIQQLENSLLVPRVMDKTIGVRPLVTLLALLAFSSLFGILGALIALPLAAVMQLLIDRFLLARSSLSVKEPGRDRLSMLRYETNQLVQDVRGQVRRKEGVPSALTDELEDEIEGIALDLESYLAGQGGD